MASTRHLKSFEGLMLLTSEFNFAWTRHLFTKTWPFRIAKIHFTLRCCVLHIHSSRDGQQASQDAVGLQHDEKPNYLKITSTMQLSSKFTTHAAPFQAQNGHLSGLNSKKQAAPKAAKSIWNTPKVHCHGRRRIANGVLKKNVLPWRARYHEVSVFRTRE